MDKTLIEAGVAVFVAFYAVKTIFMVVQYLTKQGKSVDTLLHDMFEELVETLKNQNRMTGDMVNVLGTTARELADQIEEQRQLRESVEALAIRSAMSDTEIGKIQTSVAHIEHDITTIKSDIKDIKKDTP